MKFDHLDKQIFLHFLHHQNQPFTNSQIAKALNNIQTRRDLIRKTAMIDYRLKQWIKQGLIESQIIEKKTNYFLNIEKATLGNTSLNIDQEKVDLGNCLVLHLANNTILTLSLDKQPSLMYFMSGV